MQDTVLITGASGGIGLEFAKLFAKNGYNIIITARNEKKLLELKSEIEATYKSSVIVIAKDLSKIKEAEDLVNEVKSKHIKIDILVNNAGFGDFGFFTETDWKKELEMINLNIVTLTYLTKKFTKEIVSNKSGKILNLASIAAFQPGPLSAVYYATKAYVLSFTEAIANELAGTGMTVTALCPGPTESGFAFASSGEDSNLFKGKKLPTAKDVAEFGYEALMRGKIVAVPGFKNNLLVSAVRFTPRYMVTSIVRNMNKNAKL